MTAHSLKKHYQTILDILRTTCGRSNVFALPRVQKVVVNSGIGKLTKDQAMVDDLVVAFTAITGQKPVFTKARKSISGFKVREGMPVGLMVTLRGQRMWDFLDRLVHVALPRVRDFQGVSATGVDASGNLTIGIKEHIVFPEISPEKARGIYSFQITIVSTARTREEGETLFRSLGFPFKS